ncbi:primosomal protein N' [Pseudomonas luteola]|uniref:replication restart helicase PriA n=1 Tax=Pseudomonas luteola TaxID=47886 RepID=UPI001EF6D021|nr:primosomal protein N' [Pseudomonas luteola]MCG7375312.1 primosomal protein N' [Pseudomonas luteola]
MRFIEVAVFCPVDTAFTYMWPEQLGDLPAPGCRVLVPFGRRTVMGLTLGPKAEVPCEQASKVRPVESLLDRAPLWDEASWQTWRWMAEYYHHPVGDALATTLPPGLAKGETPACPTETLVDHSGEARYKPSPEAVVSTPSQKKVLKLLQGEREGLTRLELIEKSQSPRVVDMLIRTQVLVAQRRVCREVELNPDQAKAALAIRHSLGAFAVHLLDGVTGSGKTEVYMEAIAAVIAAGCQVLYLVPEIGLTPQTCARLEQQFEVCVMHSKLSEKDRMLAWSLAQGGKASVVVGTRSALFTPMPNLGLIIVDEEHDHSFKQESHLRYHARDVAIYLARKRSVPIVLGSATPSAESLRNALAGRYHHLKLPRRASGCELPTLEIIDAKSLPFPDGLSQPAINAIAATLAVGQQAMVYLPRRGFSHSIFCKACGWASECQNCSARMVYHRGVNKLMCHHCNDSSIIPRCCPNCADQLIPLGAGTERAEAALVDRFGRDRVLRLDTDVMTTPKALLEAFTRIRSGEPLVIVGTQMLSKGHDFPSVTLVVVTGTDSALFSCDARAAERFIQQVTQVAGRSGRSKPGRVFIQTSQAEHPLLQQLIKDGYHKTLFDLIVRYEEGLMPPVSAHALMTIETTGQFEGRSMLESVIDRINHPALLGPFPALMERKAGAHRYQAVVMATNRRERHMLLSRVKQEWRSMKSRYALIIDVDPRQFS